MTLTRRRKRSKLRDLLIIIRLFIYCVAIVLINWLTYVVRGLCACVQYALAAFNTQSKNPQSVACIKDKDRTSYEKSQRRCLQRTIQAKNKTRTRDQHKKRSGSGRKKMNCSYLQPPPVEELTFTRDDAWRTKSDTLKLTQPQLGVYSGDSGKCNPDMYKTHSHRVNCSPISFSGEFKQSVSHAKGGFVRTSSNRLVSRRNLRWLQRYPHLQPKPNCRCSPPSLFHPRLTTLSQVNTGKQVRASLKMKCSQEDAMNGDNVLDDQLSSQVETWNPRSSTEKLRCGIVSDSVDRSEDDREVSPATVHHCLTTRVASHKDSNASGKLMASKEIRFLHPSLLHDLPLNCVNKAAVAKISLQNAAKTLRPSSIVDHAQFVESSLEAALKRPVKSLAGYDFCNSRSAVTKTRAEATSTPKRSNEP